ncbi:hypothetical protein WJX73_004860 [Symbiochloris irregularis]|uniref:1-acyl-sn-glycerol-3-phosphate acyltransferase n=1 Tax=Symbiochloris irregularis TaxID=706552 RepID=A0AAW1PK03_9CHLO
MESTFPPPRLFAFALQLRSNSAIRTAFACTTKSRPYSARLGWQRACSSAHAGSFAIRSCIGRLEVPKVATPNRRRPSLRHKENTRAARRLRCDASSASSSAGTLSSEAPNPGQASGLSAFLATVKAVIFYTVSLTIAVPLFVVMLALSPFMAIFDKHRRLAQHFVNDVWARLSTLLFYRVTIEGKEHLPDPKEPAVYVANHQSFLDIFTLFQLGRPFKFVSKTSIFLIPIVGWSMWLTGHIPLKRLDKRSQIACLGRCQDALKQGASVLFFPEGTRGDGRQMGAFKKGAFSVAAKAQVPVIPVTLMGTGAIMPGGKELRMYPGNVHVIIHPRVQPKQADTMMQEARRAIASSLPPGAA